MEKTIVELQYLLNILYDVHYYSPRSFGGIHPNYYSYNIARFNHEFRGRIIVDKLEEIDFASTYSNERRNILNFPTQFDEGRCVIIDEPDVYFHTSMSQTLFCYTGYLLRGELNIILEYFRSDQILQQFPSSLIVENNFIYSYMIQVNIWDRLQELLQYPKLTFNYLYYIAKYAGAKNMTTMEIQLGKIDKLLNEHILSYDFTSFDDGIILDEEN